MSEEHPYYRIIESVESITESRHIDAIPLALIMSALNNLDKVTQHDEATGVAASLLVAAGCVIDAKRRCGCDELDVIKAAMQDALEREAVRQADYIDKLKGKRE